ncbi:MAG: tetratricopeptide repeat protein [Fulvivirga sp.]
MKALLSFLCLLFLSLSGYGQDNTSQIQQSLKKAFEAQNPEEGLSYLNKVSSAANTANDSTKLEYFIAKGVAHGQLGNADSSFAFLDQAEQLAKTLTNDLQLIKVFNTKGLVLMGLSKYEEALDIFKQGLAIGEGKDEEQYLVAVRKILGNSGGIFLPTGRF